MSTTLQSVLIVLVIFCIIMSGYFSATETAFNTLNKLRVKTKADDGDKRAKLVLKLTDNYDRLLSTILVGNNIVNILAASLTTLLFVDWCNGDSGLGSTLSTVVLTVVVLIFGEVTPKSLAKEFPEKFAFFSAPIINVLGYVLTPLNFLFGLWKKLLNKIFKNKEDTTITDDELLSMVEEAEQEGGINAQESDLIKSAIEFNDLEAKDILVPRVDIVAIEDTASVEEIDNLFTETRYSRLPVYKDSIDNIVGILHEKEFVTHKYETDFKLMAQVKPAVFVVSSTKVSSVLQLLQKSKTHMAIVSGEFGETIGIITMEDILEELVGEIWDEHDEILSDITELAENEYKVLGGASMIDFCDHFDLGEIESDSSTVGGWVIEMLGKVPEVGDELTYKNLQISVTETEFRRITAIKVVVLEKEEEED